MIVIVLPVKKYIFAPGVNATSSVQLQGVTIRRPFRRTFSRSRAISFMVKKVRLSREAFREAFRLAAPGVRRAVRWEVGGGD